MSPDVEFAPTQLLKVFEYLADKHNKSRLHDAAWGIAQAIEIEDYTTGAEILDIDPAWWEKKAVDKLRYGPKQRASIGQANL